MPNKSRVLACEQCGTEFWAVFSRARFCAECRSKRRREAAVRHNALHIYKTPPPPHEPEPVVVLEVPCVICGRAIPRGHEECGCWLGRTGMGVCREHEQAYTREVITA